MVILIRNKLTGIKDRGKKRVKDGSLNSGLNNLVTSGIINKEEKYRTRSRFGGEDNSLKIP